jgi:transcriptional regulator with XRE-family HTH domain
METKNKAPHLGRKIGRIRELLGVKQESLAEQLGISQQAVSKIENSEQVEDATVERIAKALGINSQAIRNFNEELAINIISNTFTDFKDHAVASAMNYQCTFNPFDKVVELYEALLKSEREKIALLEKVLEERKQ